MSPVVRQAWPTSFAHSQGLLSPHSQMLKSIGRPARWIASRMVAYAEAGSRPFVSHQSYLT